MSSHVVNIYISEADTLLYHSDCTVVDGRPDKKVKTEQSRITPRYADSPVAGSTVEGWSGSGSTCGSNTGLPRWH